LLDTGKDLPNDREIKVLLTEERVSLLVHAVRQIFIDPPIAGLGKGLFVTGGSGFGKTHLAALLVQYALDNNIPLIAIVRAC
jgi:DNA replication protein DnaC